MTTARRSVPVFLVLILVVLAALPAAAGAATPDPQFQLGPLNPAFVEAHVNLALAYYKQMDAARSELDRAIEAATRVTREMRDDPEWADRFPADAQTDVWVTRLSLDGATLRLQQRVPTGTHGPVASELRRRLVKALVAASIGTGRWDTPLPISTEPIRS